MNPDLDPAVREIVANSAKQRVRDIEKMRPRDEYDNLMPTPLDTIVAGLVAIVVTCGIVSIGVCVMRVFGGLFANA